MLTAETAEFFTAASYHHTTQQQYIIADNSERGRATEAALHSCCSSHLPRQQELQAVEVGGSSSFRQEMSKPLN
ncbi:hypothetical protein Nepgr_014606 [Nepenthes gracilis]|uniref:Uncharacterized protein n=1 Tax=Nepenthes gracilis TaxID=150966 RepID=A0AAD3XQM8_NEPGR|nr:hypothetical protein Nepgr_014606 [Nepenthes gracilis]